LCISRILLAYKKAVLPIVSVIYYCATFSITTIFMCHIFQ